MWLPKQAQEHLLSLKHEAFARAYREQEVEGVRRRSWSANGAMTASQFANVKTAHAHEIPPKKIANEMNLPEREVNRAIIAADYASYLETD
jgi:hypothetical protein